LGVNARFHIGRLARETGRSAHAIRWYEQQGLIPGVTRDASGRRVYSEQHVGWLLFLDRLRFAGMSVREMRRYAGLVSQGKKTLRQRLDLLQAHHARTTALIDDLQSALRLIERKQAYYTAWLENGHRPGDFEVSPITEVRTPPRQQAATVRGALVSRRPRAL
jgi:DNA-binding transcriptional MerR regulator